MTRNKNPKCTSNFPTSLFLLALALPVADLVEGLVELVLPNVVV
jgi:hypothetical protein